MRTPCNVQTKQTSKNKKLVESQCESYCLLHGSPFFVSLKPFMTLSVHLRLLSYGQIRFFTNGLMCDNI